jgi:hypothetical protein
MDHEQKVVKPMKMFNAQFTGEVKVLKNMAIFDTQFTEEVKSSQTDGDF